MADLTNLVKRYLNTWNVTDADARRTAIAEIWAENGVYTDPLATAEGPEGFNAVIEGAQGQFPGFTFRLLGDVDTHHNIARFQWELLPAAGGEAPVVGFDIAVVNEQGRIQSVYGFLDRVPAAA